MHRPLRPPLEVLELVGERTQGGLPLAELAKGVADEALDPGGHEHLHSGLDIAEASSTEVVEEGVEA